MWTKALFSKRYRNFVLGVLFLGYVVNFIDRSILSILLEPIKLDLELNDTQLGLLGGLAFAIFYSTLGVPIAALAVLANLWATTHYFLSARTLREDLEKTEALNLQAAAATA
jgi:sugar phosphate permease|tara:strand:+ start:2453 stop:2788 length:336 start_codon:yes stop_codon:yes gene_type:complete